MFHFYSDDGRILTPPKELKPMLKDSFASFYKLIGHLRFYYMADEIWDGKTSIIFYADNNQLAAITICEGSFYVVFDGHNIQIFDESALDIVYEKLSKTATVNQRRPMDQISVDLVEYPSGIRCDMCLLHISHNRNDYEGCRKFPIMDRTCYYGVEEGWGETVFLPVICDGKQCYTKTYKCLEKKGFKNCLECGEYRICGDCGVGHDPGECNLGITAEEITSLILPYCEVERLDFIAKGMTHGVKLVLNR